MTIGDFLGGGHTINVDTDVLVAKAAEVDTKVAEMKKQFGVIDDLIKNTSNYWIGEAGDLHRKMYYDQQEDVADILKRLSEHPEHLRQAANIYTGYANDSKTIMESLPGDAIE